MSKIKVFSKEVSQGVLSEGKIRSQVSRNQDYKCFKCFLFYFLHIPVSNYIYIYFFFLRQVLLPMACNLHCFFSHSSEFVLNLYQGNPTSVCLFVHCDQGHLQNYSSSHSILPRITVSWSRTVLRKVHTLFRLDKLNSECTSTFT